MFSIFILLLFINDKQHLLIDVIDFLISGLVLLRHCSRIAKDVGSNPSNMPVIFFFTELGKVLGANTHQCKGKTKINT